MTVYRAMTIMCLLASPAFAQNWWNSEWSHRRPVEVETYRATRLPGEDLAVVTLLVTDDMQQEGQDIRVIASDGDVCDHRVLQVGPGNLITVAFAPLDGPEIYHIYWGNPNVNAPKTPLNIQRGVLQETWAYPGGAIDTFEEVQNIFAKASVKIGCGFRPTVFQGFNPFGPEEAVASLFTAYFVVPADGEYIFCISSRNASFLEVDDELLLSNGGRHDPQRDVTIQATISLSKGFHKARFYHVSPGGDPIVVLAWQPPGANRIWPMATTDFTSVARGVPGLIDLRDTRDTIDFMPQHVGEAFARDHYYQRYRFEAMTDSTFRGKVTWEWDFGDGLTAEGESTSHVYLADGDYAVTLKRTTREGTDERTYRLVVERPWEMVIRKDVNPASDYAQQVSAYDFDALDPEGLAGAILLFDGTDRGQDASLAGRALLAADTLPASTAIEAMFVLTERYRADGNSQKAVDALVKASDKVEAPEIAAGMLIYAADVTLSDLMDPDAGEALLDDAENSLGALTQDSQAQLRNRLRGDVWRLRGDAAQAGVFYAAAEPEQRKLVGRESMMSGDFARHVESYLKDENLDAAQDALDRWAQTLPACKLDGYWSLLQVRTHILAGDNDFAAAEAKILVGVNPESSYGGELLMLAANAHHREGDTDQIVAILKQIVELYPESEYAAQARELLNK